MILNGISLTFRRNQFTDFLINQSFYMWISFDNVVFSFCVCLWNDANEIQMLDETCMFWCGYLFRHVTKTTYYILNSMFEFRLCTSQAITRHFVRQRKMQARDCRNAQMTGNVSDSRFFSLYLLSLFHDIISLVIEH